MSQEHKTHHESPAPLEKGEKFDVSKEVRDRLAELEQAETTSSEQTEKSTEAIRKKVEVEAKTAEDLKQKEQPTNETNDTYSTYSHLRLKVDAYSKLLVDIQSRLSPREKRFSSFVHKPIIESVSEVASKTIARPVGIAWGSLITFLGVIVSLFFAYRYGISFNYLLFVLLFIVGYTATTILELGFKLAFRKKQL